MADAAVHATHCCPRHGCKYGDNNCPVEHGELQPYYPNNNGCEQCEWYEQEQERYAQMQHIVTVKVKGLTHSLTLKENFTEKPSDSQVKDVVGRAKKSLHEVHNQSARTIDTTIMPSGSG